MYLPVTATRTLFPWLMLLMVHAVIAAPRQETSCDPEIQTPTAYAMCLATYTVTNQLLHAKDCTTMQPNKPDEVAQPLGGINLGVCLFHRFDTPEHNQRAIEVLQQAQLVGLSPNHTAAAQLLEGLLHCRQARHHRAAILAAKTPEAVAAGRWGQDLFCMERRLGTTAIADLAWEYAEIHYAADIPTEDSWVAKPEYRARLQELGACYDQAQNGPFHPDFATQCREDAANDETTVRTLATQETSALVGAYLTSSNPFSAMFSRKEDLVKGVKERSASTIVTLTAEVKLLRERYNQQAQILDEQKSRVDPLIKRYESALQLGYNIMDNYERWIRQFWLHPTEGDLKTPLETNCRNLANQTVNIQAPDNQPKSANCPGTPDPSAVIKVADLTALEGLLERIKSTVTQADAQQAAVKSMCRLYFCHLLADPLQLYTARICKTKPFLDNPLCNFTYGGPVRASIVSPNDKSLVSPVVEICRRAGLPEQFLTAGLPHKQRVACFSGN